MKRISLRGKKKEQQHEDEDGILGKRMQRDSGFKKYKPEAIILELVQNKYRPRNLQFCKPNREGSTKVSEKRLCMDLAG